MRLAQNILLIDGECMLCQHITRFVIRHDRKGKFMFASLQSEAGISLLKQFDLPADYRDTFVMIRGKKHYKRSNAALRVCRELGGAWSMLFAFIIVPRVVRDVFYNIVAKKRYRIFGKADQCLMPTAELRSRFIETNSELKRYGWQQ